MSILRYETVSVDGIRERDNLWRINCCGWQGVPESVADGKKESMYTLTEW